MNPIYYDGTKYYKIGKHKDGSYVKFEVDNVGTYKCGGSVHKYGGHLDMNMDVSKMYQVGGQISNNLNNYQRGGWENGKFNEDRYVDEMTRIIKESNSGKELSDDDRVELLRFNRESTKESAANDPMFDRINKQVNGTWYQQGLNWLKDKFALENLPLGGWNKKESGGSIHINPENRGKFTASAKQRGIGVQEFAHKVMSNKENYSPTMVKRANFAINSTKFKHQDGGQLPTYQGSRNKSSYISNYNFDPNSIMDNTRPYTEDDFQIVPRGSDSEVYITPDGKVNEFQIMPESGYTSKLSNVNKFNFKTQPSVVANTSTNTIPVSSNHQDFNPRKLTTYGDRIAESALNRTTAYNLARSLEPAYKNPLIMPEFKFKKQFAQADFNPVYEMQNVGMRNMANNARSTAALMGNLQQTNANMVKAKSKIAGNAQTQQRGYDATFAGQQQDWENKLAQARQNVENLNKGDEAEKFNFLSDTMTNWEKADQQRAKLYNANLQNWNEMNTYVNQLSPEYQAVRDKEGVVKIVFKSTGKEVPAEHFAKAQAEYNARIKAGQAGTTTNTTSTAKTFEIGGKVTKTNTPNKIKKLRTGLY